MHGIRRMAMGVLNGGSSLKETESFAAPETCTNPAKHRPGPRGGETGLATEGACRFFAQRPVSKGRVCPIDLPTDLAPAAATAKPVSPNPRAGKERDA